jgi:bifunctional non-homologous end joining protein LigD
MQYSEDFPGAADGGKKLLATACAHGLEGLIAKRADGAYRSGRHHDWLKIKCRHEQEFVIIGFSPSSRGRAFASILLAVNESSKLRYAGRVGTGFAEADLAQLATLRDRNKISAPACEHIPQAMARGVTWVKPALIAHVAFAGWTAEKLIRHGRFKGQRHDKVPNDII